MKKIAFSIVFVLQFLIVHSQYVSPEAIPLKNFKILDSTLLCVNYKMTYASAILQADSNIMTMTDNQELLVGKFISKYYSRNLMDYSIYINNHEWSKSLEAGSCSFEIFKNYPTNKLTVTDQAGAFMLGGNYKYIEDIPSIQWKIESDTTIIQHYSCQKARATFRGRNYTAWFAPEIPLNNGPWKFGGLPGLILKISDDGHRCVFECIGIKQLDKPEPIKFYNLKYITLKREEMDKVYRRYFKDPIQFWSDVLSERRGQITADELPKMHYDPIELE